MVAPSPAQWGAAAYLCGRLIPGERLVVGSLMPGIWAFPGGSDGKEPICNARDPGSIPAWGISPEKGMATHSSILVWRLPWTEEPGGLQFIGLQKDKTEAT